MGLISPLSNCSIAFAMYIHVHHTFRASKNLFCSCMVQWIYLSSVVEFDQPQPFLDTSMAWTQFSTFLQSKSLPWSLILNVVQIQKESKPIFEVSIPRCINSANIWLYIQLKSLMWKIYQSQHLKRASQCTLLDLLYQI